MYIWLKNCLQMISTIKRNKCFVNLHISYRGRLRQHRSCCNTDTGPSFLTLSQVFQTLGRAFDFLLRLQKLDRVFRKLGRASAGL